MLLYVSERAYHAIVLSDPCPVTEAFAMHHPWLWSGLPAVSAYGYWYFPDSPIFSHLSDTVPLYGIASSRRQYSGDIWVFVEVFVAAISPLSWPFAGKTSVFIHVIILPVIIEQVDLVYRPVYLPSDPAVEIFLLFAFIQRAAVSPLSAAIQLSRGFKRGFDTSSSLFSDRFPPAIIPVHPVNPRSNAVL